MSGISMRVVAADVAIGALMLAAALVSSNFPNIMLAVCGCLLVSLGMWRWLKMARGRKEKQV